ncbi:glutathione synthetase, chloroplastic-like [Malus sylvestris]|uniref:glutathione synthetase, chloroplastic-like n=1 Tax=Malus sylvestris TaxID=3752 RepID=UPI0021ABC9C9|nr:glutathione synthetase, chloroplastic-like [Malus sylvestris]
MSLKPLLRPPPKWSNMGTSYSSCSHSTTTLSTHSLLLTHPKSSAFKQSGFPNPDSKFHSTHQIPQTHLRIMSQKPSQVLGGKVEVGETQEEISKRPMIDFHGIDEGLVEKMVYDALVWSSLHGLVVGDKSVQRSGKVPGVGMVHAPFALFPMPFPESHWKQAYELSPIFNELVDRVSLDAKFLQDSLSRTKKVDAFTSRLLDIHSKMLEINKKEDIRLGLHRSDYMLDEETKQLLQIEMNTISSSFPGLGCLVSDLHRSLLNHYGEYLGLDSRRVPNNPAATQFVEALAKAWTEYNNPRSVILFVVQPEERNMYDQHWLSALLKERHNVSTLRKTLAEIDSEGKLRPDGTLVVGGQEVAIVYFRAGYTPIDYPSESEWRARFLMEQSSAIKCPSISYHLVGTKKIQQELAKPNVLERFLNDKEDIAKLRKCFAGLWSLDDSDIVRKAIEIPGLFVMKPQREGGGNNIYGDDVREALVRLQKEGSEADAAYILMQRIFPTVSHTFLMREGICYKDDTISELGVYGAYLRNKDKVILNDQCGYLMRTKVSSSDEGGVAAGFAVLDSLYLT